MKNSISCPSILNKNSKFNNRVHKLLIHDFNESESKSDVLSKIKKIIKTEKSLYYKNFDFNYSREYHTVRNQLNNFNKSNKSKNDLISYLRNENKKFKKLFQTNTKEFKTLSFNSLNKQKNLKKTLSLLINNNYENNIFNESPLLMSNNKDINLYYSHYDESNNNVHKDKITHIPIIDEKNDESIKFSNKLLNALKRTILKKRHFLSSNDIIPKINQKSNSEEKEEHFSYNLSKNKNKNFMKEINKQSMELIKYNNSIKKLIDNMNKSKNYFKRFDSRDGTSDLRYRGMLRKSNFDVKYNLRINQLNKDKKGKIFNKKYSMAHISPRKQRNTTSIFEKLFKDILKNKKLEKKKSFSHLESIYYDIQNIKSKFLSYEVDKKLNLDNLNNLKLTNLKNRNNRLIENEQKENKLVKNLDFEFLWRFHDYKNFK